MTESEKMSSAAQVQEWPTALQFADFTFAYSGGSLVLAGVDWTVREGAFCLLTGDTGCGKTTLLRQAKPSMAPVGRRGGTCAVFGRAAFGQSGDDAVGVGYVAQSPENQLVCDTVWHEMAFGLENMGMPQDVMGRRVAEVAHYFGIEPWFHRGVNDLSGGQKQLLNLASVLVMRPRLLLLDEPTAQLDPVSAANFCHALFRLNRELGLTVVVATHAPELFADYATEAVCLREGRIRAVELGQLRPQPFALPAEGERTSAGEGATGDQPSAIRGAADGSRNVVVELRDAYVRYAKGDPFVLRGADLRISKGCIHALVGGNACGKSTLLKTAAGLLKPSRGAVCNTLAASQALLPQNPQALFVCDTVQDELMEWSSGCGYGSADVDAWLFRIGLAEERDRHPYDLSGGQKQLLAFAKVALTRPRLLLLDEPTKGLDPRAKLTLARLLRDLTETGTTTIMATHDLAFAACVADDASLLFDGQVASTGTVASFFAQNLFYRPRGNGFTRLWDEGLDAPDAVGCPAPQADRSAEGGEPC